VSEASGNEMGDREMGLRWMKVEGGVYRSRCGKWTIRKVHEQRSCWWIEGPANTSGTRFRCSSTSLPRGKNIADYNRNWDVGVVPQNSPAPESGTVPKVRLPTPDAPFIEGDHFEVQCRKLIGSRWGRWGKWFPLWHQRTDDPEGIICLGVLRSSVDKDHADPTTEYRLVWIKVS
jgi:hypothetical protein